MELESKLPAFLHSRLDAVVGWCRQYSIWPLPFATACCGIELMASACSRFDIARFGSEALRFSPRQSDLLIVAGRVTVKMLPVLQRIYLQMTEPKWVISMGACCSTGGEFNTYAVVQGIDQFLPVDVYLPGCPPRPEQLLEGIMAIQRFCRLGNPQTSRPLGIVVGPPRAAVPDELKPQEQDWQKPPRVE
ncbi:MAG: NADH-quinone oxidoreductase subunit NuoB [Sedimentisphaerales bacterium]|nr:NADH-quinone oxidoreductase subunit NuoB [Sedimentisphaerales bacterium]